MLELRVALLALKFFLCWDTSWSAPTTQWWSHTLITRVTLTSWVSTVVQVDILSRQSLLQGEWRLHPEVVQQIWEIFSRQRGTSLPMLSQFTIECCFPYCPSATKCSSPRLTLWPTVYVPRSFIDSAHPTQHSAMEPQGSVKSLQNSQWNPGSHSWSSGWDTLGNLSWAGLLS